jgi:nucleotide-binding universal stress UspA family protein
MARTILVPLDGSPAAESILAEAARVLPPKGKVHLLLLLPPKSKLQGIDYLDEVRKRAFPNNGGCNLVRRGSPVDGILRAALEKNVDLIAMTTHARHGLGRWVLGSVAAEVVKKSQLPVLLNRADTPAPGRTIRRILVPVDGTRTPSELLETLRLLCPDSRAELILLRVMPPQQDPAPQWALEFPLSHRPEPERRLQEMADLLEEEGFTAWPMTSVGGAEEEILTIGTKLGVDLIAMSTQGHDGLELFLEGSVSEKVLRQSPVAVLLQKPLVVYKPSVAGGTHA